MSAPSGGDDHARKDARIEAALRGLGAELEPPVGWEARVLGQATAARPASPWRWWLAGLAMAVAVVAVWLVVPRRGADAPLALAIAAEPGAGSAGTMRGAALHLHDVLAARATGAGALAIWIYRNDELVLRCPGAAACSTEAGALVARLPVTAVGEYQIVALTGAAPAGPTHGLDRDVADARAAGAATVTRTVTVR